MRTVSKLYAIAAVVAVTWEIAGSSSSSSPQGFLVDATPSPSSPSPFDSLDASSTWTQQTPRSVATTVAVRRGQAVSGGSGSIGTLTDPNAAAASVYSEQSYLQRQLRVTCIAVFCNMLFNALYPGILGLWPLRIPRFLWEMAIYVTATRALKASSRTVHNDDAGTSVRLYVLAVMTLNTALIDIFIWAPLSAMTISLAGPYYLPMAIQCILSGVVYLGTAMAALDAASRVRRREKLALQQAIVERIVHGPL